MSACKKLILPSILLFAALLLREPMVGLYAEYGQLFDWMPYLAVATSIALALFYNLSRIFLASLFTLTVYIVIQNELQTTLENFSALYAYTAICIIAPGITLLLLYLPEKGLRNKYGALSLGVTLMIMIVPVIVRYSIQEQVIVDFINTYFSIRPIDQYVQSVNTSLLFLIIFITGIARLVKANEDFIAANLSLLVIIFITLSFFYIEKISTILFTANALILISSSLRSSYNLAYRDELTGLLSRRALNDRLKTLGKTFVIAMTDVDHFKKFNDTYGHDIGDDVLKMVAKNLESVKGGGISHRYGGEEFCIVFPGKTLDEAEPFLEAIRKKVENYEMVVRNTDNRPEDLEKALERRGRRKKIRENNKVSVTISVGAAESNDASTRPEDVLKTADSALYKAKQQGRNCLILATK